MSTSAKVWLCLIGMIVLTVTGVLFIDTSPGIAGVCFLADFIVIIVGNKVNKQLKEEMANAQKELYEKPISQWTPAEKERELRKIEEQFRNGLLTFQQYDVLKAHYTGNRSFTEMYGKNYTAALSDKIAADRALEKHIKESEKSIITTSAVANAIGGLGCGIAQAASTANKANVETQRLMKNQEEAKKRLEDAMIKNIK